MTPSQIIAEARILINDTATPYRQADTELLEYVNQGLREACVVNPTLFSTISQHTCTGGTCEQELSATDSAALIEVLCIHNGNALLPFDFNAMNAFNPGWRTDAEGAATQWTKFANDPRKFYIYPKPINVMPYQVIDVRHAKVPTVYALGDTITELADVYKPALANYVASRAEMKDDENVLNERAAALYNAFATQIKG